MKNVKVYDLEWYGEKYHIVLGKGNYVSNGTFAVLMYVSTPKGKIKEDFGDLTKNIGNSDIYANKTNTQFVDTNNLGESIIRWLVDNNIAKEKHVYGSSGFCTYPLVEFTQEAINGMLKLE